MKKALVLFLAVLFCLPACFPAFADMGGPEMIGYTATVKTQADYYDWEWNEGAQDSTFKKIGTIPAGTVLEISSEYTQNGVLYGYFYDAASLGGKSGYVRTSDLSLGANSVYPKEKGYRQSVSVRLRVTEPNGMKLYAGPSAVYAEVTTIPFGTELTADTLDQQSYDSGAWMYMTYGGKGGWANCWLYDGTYCPAAELLPSGETGTIWVVKDKAALRDKNNKELITVPKGEKLTFNAFNRTAHTIFYHVTYQGKNGIFSVNDDGYDNVVASDRNEATYYRAQKVKQGFLTSVYAYPDDRLPKGTVRYQSGDTIEGQFLYYAEPLEEYRGGVEWVYIEKNGQKGWIKPDQSKLESRDWENVTSHEIPSVSDSKVIEQPVTTTAPVTTTTTIPETVSQTNAPYTPVLTEAETETAAEEQSTFAQFEPVEQTSSVASPVPTRPFSPVGKIVVCIAAAAILALTASVTLRLIHRKKDGEDQP